MKKNGARAIDWRWIAKKAGLEWSEFRRLHWLKKIELLEKYEGRRT